MSTALDLVFACVFGHTASKRARITADGDFDEMGPSLNNGGEYDARAFVKQLPEKWVKRLDGSVGPNATNSRKDHDLLRSVKATVG
jgi:hypothetical protein